MSGRRAPPAAHLQLTQEFLGDPLLQLRATRAIDECRDTDALDIIGQKSTMAHQAVATACKSQRKYRQNPYEPDSHLLMLGVRAGRDQGARPASVVRSRRTSSTLRTSNAASTGLEM